MVVHLLPLGIAADKSGNQVVRFLNASGVVAWALAGLELPVVLMHLSPSNWQRGDVLCLLFPFVFHQREPGLLIFCLPFPRNF